MLLFPWFHCYMPPPNLRVLLPGSLARSVSSSAQVRTNIRAFLDTLLSRIL